MLSAALGCAAAAPSVQARLDSATLLMGRMTLLHVQTVTDAGAHGDFPMIHTATQEGIIPLLDDTVELRSSFTTDTVKLGSGRVQIDYHFPLQSFIPGSYLLPKIAFVAGRDTAWSNQVALRVVPLDLKATDSIAPDAPPVGPFYKNGFQKFTDSIPDVLYYYWWVILIGILLIGGLIFYFTRRGVKSIFH